MMYRVSGYYALNFVIIVPARIHITVKSGKITARYLDPDPVAGSEVVACRHWLKNNLVDLP